jgi:hypothetical protein
MLEGGCHCGAVRYRVDGAPIRAGLCHCSDCRRHNGAPVVGWAVFAEESVQADGELATYRSSEHGRRFFCRKCGTGLLYRNQAAMPGLVDVQIATLDHPDALPPTEQIQVLDRIGWMETAHLLQAYDRFPPDL